MRAEVCDPLRTSAGAGGGVGGVRRRDGGGERGGKTHVLLAREVAAEVRADRVPVAARLARAPRGEHRDLVRRLVRVAEVADGGAVSRRRGVGRAQHDADGLVVDQGHEVAAVAHRAVAPGERVDVLPVDEQVLERQFQLVELRIGRVDERLAQLLLAEWTHHSTPFRPEPV